MVTNRKDYMRAYMRKYRAQKQGMVPKVNHAACDKQIEELQQTIEARDAEIKSLREMLPF